MATTITGAAPGVRRRHSYGGFRVGDRVRCERAEPAKGTWKRYAGREGVVVALNYGEIGVA